MRKKNSILNMIGSMGSYSMTLIFSFVTQACIIRFLGIEYSGVNGLFTNIITMLSIAELGIGTTIIFKLYKPIAEKNKEEIKSWMKFYKICYRYVALFVAIIGIILIPFVPAIVGKVTIPDNIIFLYIITLLDTVLSYIMTYKRSLLYADQKNYVINIVHMGYVIFMNVTQILLLYLTKNYVVFLMIKLVYRLLENIIINIYVDKNYPYINEKSKNIAKEEKQDLFNRIKAIFLQKISFVINKGIDSITISFFLGIAAVGYYTNYNLIATALSGIIFQIVSALCASVGSLLTENDSEKSYAVYKKINMLNSFLTSVIIAGFIAAIQPFISLWLGEDYLLPNIVIISFSIYIYADSIRRSITIYKEAAGICKEDQFMYVIMALINLISSVLLCKWIGTSGVILGTALSYLFLIIYSYPKYIFYPLFNKSYKEYYIENFKYLIFIIFTSCISFFIGKILFIRNFFLTFLLDGFLSVIVVTILFIFIYRKTEEFNFYIEFLNKLKTKLIK